jgi:transposase
MRAAFRLSDLIPAELAAEAVTEEADTIIVNARAVSPSGSCPRCGTASSRVHSRYVRTVSDLPCCGRRVDLRVVVRRFVCTASHCRQKIFAERFGDGVLPLRSRRTARWNVWSIISVLPWAAVPRRTLPNG